MYLTFFKTYQFVHFVLARGANRTCSHVLSYKSSSVFVPRGKFEKNIFQYNRGKLKTKTFNTKVYLFFISFLWTYLVQLRGKVWLKSRYGWRLIKYKTSMNSIWYLSELKSFRWILKLHGTINIVQNFSKPFLFPVFKPHFWVIKKRFAFAARSKASVAKLIFFLLLFASWGNSRTQLMRLWRIIFFQEDQHRKQHKHYNHI